MVLMPGYRLLDPTNTGVAGDQFARLGPNHAFMMFVGSLVALGLGGIVVLSVGAARIDRMLQWTGKALERPGSMTYASMVGGVAFAAYPTTIDQVMSCK